MATFSCGLAMQALQETSGSLHDILRNAAKENCLTFSATHNTSFRGETSYGAERNTCSFIRNLPCNDFHQC